MTLAPTGARGKYLALWIVARNLGQLVGGAIKLVIQSFNQKSSCDKWTSTNSLALVDQACQRTMRKEPVVELLQILTLPL